MYIEERLVTPIILEACQAVILLKENAYLIIHGFAGDLEEIEYLASYLRKKGLDTYTVLLEGHGGGKKDLHNSSYKDWIKSVSDMVNKLKQTHRQINLIGFSMGGLISVHFSSMPEINKLVFINTPISFWNIKIIINDIINGIRYRQLDKIMYYKKSVLGASAKSGLDFLNLLFKSKPKFKEVQKKSLIIQCTNDESVHFKSARYIKRKIGNKAKLRLYRGGCHQIFSDSVTFRNRVCYDIYKFLVSPAI